MSAEEEVGGVGGDGSSNYVILVLVLACLLLLLTITLILCCLTRTMLPRAGTTKTTRSPPGVQRDSETQTWAGSQTRARPARPGVQMGTQRSFLCGGLGSFTSPDYEEYQYDRRLHPPPALPPPAPPYLYSWPPPPPPAVAGPRSWTVLTRLGLLLVRVLTLGARRAPPTPPAAPGKTGPADPGYCGISRPRTAAVCATQAPGSMGRTGSVRGTEK